MIPIREGSVLKRKYITERVEVVLIGDYEVVLENEVGHLHTIPIAAVTDGSHEVVQF